MSARLSSPVHENVYSSVIPNHRGNHRSYSRVIACIGYIALHIGSSDLSDFHCSSIERRPVTRHDCNPSPFARQLPGNGLSDAFAAPGDNCDFPGEMKIHVSPHKGADRLTLTCFRFGAQDGSVSGEDDAADLIQSIQVPARRDPARRGAVFSLYLSIRDVEELMLQRGIVGSRKAIRCWVNKFGPLIAANHRGCRAPPSH